MAIFSRRVNPEKLMDWQAKASAVGTTDPVKAHEDDSLAKAIELMQFFGFRRLPIVAKGGELRGIITTTDVLELLAAGKRMDTPVQEVMNSALFIDHWSSLYRSLAAFHRLRKGGYPVVRNDVLKGMLTDFDIMKRIERPLGISVSAAMTPKPVVVGEHESLLHASFMMARGFRRLPVVQKGILVGIITPHDVISALHGGRDSLRKSGKVVGDVMARDVIVVSPDVDVYEAIRLMKSARLGGLPVAEDRELFGIITERDIVNLLRP